MFAAPRIVDTSTKALHSNVVVVSDGLMEPHHWGYGQRREGDPRMAQQSSPDDWIGATKRLRKSGIETLGDLGRLAEARGVDAALRLLSEACSSTR